MQKKPPVRRTPTRGVRPADVRRLLLRLPNISRGRTHGHPSFLLNGQFLARFRDDDTVLVLRLATIDDRALLMELDSRAFFFTDHYRNYATVLIRLAEVPPGLLASVVRDSWRHVAAVTTAEGHSKRRKGKARRRAAT